MPKKKEQSQEYVGKKKSPGKKAHSPHKVEPVEERDEFTGLLPSEVARRQAANRRKDEFKQALDQGLAGNRVRRWANGVIGRNRMFYIRKRETLLWVGYT
jgi:hypothetical protein